MIKTKILPLLLLFIIFTSCGGAKYDYHFEKGKEINFENGKWLLNEPFTNYKSNDAYSYAKKELEIILGDSLIELVELRQTKIIGKQLPLNPTAKELKEIKALSNCDFLINIESKIIKDEMGNSEHSTNIGTVTKYNQASSKIQIYDLNKLDLISESTSFGEVKVKKTPEDNGIIETVFNYTTPGRTLALNTIKKLIRQYKKHQKE